MPKSTLLALTLSAFLAHRLWKSKQTVDEERETRGKVITEVAYDVHAIHKATDVVNARIERGEISSWEDLEQAVLNEVAFQKMAIREE